VVFILLVQGNVRTRTKIVLDKSNQDNES